MINSPQPPKNHVAREAPVTNQPLKAALVPCGAVHPSHHHGNMRQLLCWPRGRRTADVPTGFYGLLTSGRATNRRRFIHGAAQLNMSSANAISLQLARRRGETKTRTPLKNHVAAGAQRTNQRGWLWGADYLSTH